MSDSTLLCTRQVNDIEMHFFSKKVCKNPSLILKSNGREATFLYFEAKYEREGNKWIGNKQIHLQKRYINVSTYRYIIF